MTGKHLIFALVLVAIVVVGSVLILIAVHYGDDTEVDKNGVNSGARVGSQVGVAWPTLR